MKLEIPALESEPLIYFLFHSSVFVVALGTTFFFLGLWLAWLNWGRYKSNNRGLQTEVDRLEEEIISLKRKLAEQVIRAPAIRVPVDAPVSNPVLPVPASANESVQAAQPAVGGKVAEAVMPTPASSVDRGVIDEAFPVIPSLSQDTLNPAVRKGLSLSPLRTRNNAKTAPEPHVPLQSPKPRRFPLPDASDSSGVEPFSFLMGPAPEVTPKAAPPPESATAATPPSMPAAGNSSLNDVIASKVDGAAEAPVAKEEVGDKVAK